MKKENIISIIITLVLAGILYYLFLPAINLHSLAFLTFVLFLIFVYTLVLSVLSLFMSKKPKIALKSSKFLVFSVIGIFAFITLSDIICSPLFNSKSYSKRITINTDKNFINDIKEVDFSKLPLLDKDSSSKLGDRTMGRMPEMVSQYYVSDNYSQINYDGNIVRVTPLEYNGFFKWLKNKDKGVTGYIKVNSVDGSSDLVTLEKGMKYTESAFFNKNLFRHLRFKYPTFIFGDANFELDNDGNPYYVVPVMKYTAVGLKRDVKGVVVVNPITGDTEYYKLNDIPAWVDHVFPADLIIEQVDDWGLYQKGFLNSVFSQTGVVMTTDGYNYLVLDDDVYMYTGITSVSTDESNIGFILTNLRTKETNFYQVPGAEEYSAMASAEGQVQQMKYTSTFPLLINLNNRPTYLVSLKDNAGLVKMYGFIDVEDYQKVVVTDASLGIEKAKDNYLNSVPSNVTGNEEEKTIIINSIKDVMIDGNTYYYLTDTDNNKYRVNIKVNKDILPFLSKGDKVKVYYKLQNGVTELNKLEQAS